MSRVWPLFDIRKWPEISKIYTAVSINTKIVRLKTTAEIISRFSLMKIHYAVMISAWLENEKLAYNRFDGPLPGHSEWILSKIENGTRIDFRNDFLHNLGSGLQQEIAENMQNFLQDLKRFAEE